MDKITKEALSGIIQRRNAMRENQALGVKPMGQSDFIRAYPSSAHWFNWQHQQYYDGANANLKQRVARDTWNRLKQMHQTLEETETERIENNYRPT